MIRSQLLKEYKQAKSNNVNHQGGTGGTKCPLPLPYQGTPCFPTVSLPIHGTCGWQSQKPTHGLEAFVTQPPTSERHPLEQEVQFSCLCWEQCMSLTSVLPGTLPCLTAVLPYLQSLLLSHDSCQPPLVLVFSLFIRSFIIHLTNTVVVIPQHTLPSSGT